MKMELVILSLLKNVINFDSRSSDVIKYLKGETLMKEVEKAFYEYFNWSIGILMLINKIKF